MKQLSVFLMIILLFLICFIANAQQGNVTAGGLATGSGGTLSYSVGQTDYLAYSSASGNLNMGLQQTWSEGGYVVPDVNLVQNFTITYDDNECFDATQTVIIAGEGTYFALEDGGYVEIIAGENILIKDGATVESGGYMHAWITMDNTYCGMTTSMLAVNEDEAPDAITLIHEQDYRCCNVFPNPTTGRFTMTLSNFSDYNSLIVEVYSMQGYLIFQNESPAQDSYNLSLTGMPPGLYLLRIMAGGETCFCKVLKK
jgi:hypothetical protein